MVPLVDVSPYYPPTLKSHTPPPIYYHIPVRYQTLIFTFLPPILGLAGYMLPIFLYRSPFLRYVTIHGPLSLIPIYLRLF